MLRIESGENPTVGKAVCQCGNVDFNLLLLTIDEVTKLFAMCLNCKRFTALADYADSTKEIH